MSRLWSCQHRISFFRNNNVTNDFMAVCNLPSMTIESTRYFHDISKQTFSHNSRSHLHDFNRKGRYEATKKQLIDQSEPASIPRGPAGVFAARIASDCLAKTRCICKKESVTITICAFSSCSLSLVASSCSTYLARSRPPYLKRGVLIWSKSLSRHELFSRSFI